MVALATNVEAMTSKGLRSDALSTDTKLDASYNVELPTKTFIGYSLCYMPLFFDCQTFKNKNMETLLFKDSEVFVKERPIKLSEKQETEIWQKLAKEVIDNGWSDDDIDTIIEDLQSLSMSDSGYEMAKDLEGYRANGSYDIDTSFIEWLDMLDSDFDDARRENVKRWVKAHDIKPKHEKGTQLLVKEHFTRSPELQVGKVIFVNGFYENEAKYCVSNEKDSKRNVLIIYENIERCCVVS